MTNYEAEEKVRDCVMTYRETFVIGAEPETLILDKRYFKAPENG